MKMEELLNMDADLSMVGEDDPKVTGALAEKCHIAGFELVGSNAIMHLPTHDIDFMCAHTVKNTQWLTDNGFMRKEVAMEYMDDFTVSVWYHPSAPNSIQVVTKDPAHWQLCLKIWEMFRAFPALYSEYFWKSNPDKYTDRNMVRERINAFGKFISVLEQTSMELE